MVYSQTPLASSNRLKVEQKFPEEGVYLRFFMPVKKIWFSQIRTEEDTEIMGKFSCRHVVQIASFHWDDALEIRVRRRWEDPDLPKSRMCLEQRK